MNQSGQAFDVFHLLISAILGLAILVIIIGAINYISLLREEISQKKLFDGVKSSVRSPNGDVVKIDNIILKRGSYGPRTFELQTGISKDCIDIQGSDIDAFELQGNSITVKQPVLTDVFASCNVAPSSECEIRCLISFGKEIGKEN